MNPLCHVKGAFGFFWNKIDDNERWDVLYRFIVFVFQEQDYRTADLVVALPQVYCAFFTPLLAYSETHKRDVLCFPNGDVFYMHIEQNELDYFEDERIFHFVWWSGGVRNAYMGQLPALYCC